MGDGHFSPAGIGGVHTYLCYYRPIQHIAVPGVIQYTTYIYTPITHTHTERGYSTSLDRGV